MSPTTIFMVLPPEDLAAAADLSFGAMWGTLRIWLVPICLFIIFHSLRRMGG